MIAIAMGKGILWLTAVTLLSLVAAAHAQTNQGKDFWLAQTTNLQAGGNFAIAIANPSGSVANITIAHDGSADLLGTIPSGALQTYPFPQHEYACSAGGVNYGKPRVYHVTSDVDVTVQIFNPLENILSNDVSLVLPVTALGKLHRAGGYVNWSNSRGPFLGVVAAKNGTNIQVFDRAGTLMDNVTIDQGEYFERVSGSCGGSSVLDDLTGWSVVTSVPAVVFSGSFGTSVGNSPSAYDHLEEQVLPEEVLDDSYVASPTLSRPLGCLPTVPGSCTQDVFRYVATAASTTVTTSPNVGGGLLVNPGDFIEITTATPHIVAADKPIYGYQYLVSEQSGSPQAGTGDPSMVAMPPVAQFQFSYIFLTPGTFAYDFINLIAPVGTTFNLDGSPLADTCTPIGTIGGVTYCFIVKPVADGVHKISGDKKFGLIVSGFDHQASYAYLGGVGLQPINAGCYTGGPYQVELCNVPTAIPLNGTSSCLDGSTPTVSWSSNSGVTFNNPAAEDPTATVPAFGTFDITMTVQCAGAAQPVQCSSTIKVDQKTQGCNQPPDCSAARASPSTLWPPNHQMVPIAITAVTDPDGDAVSITATSITQDEAVRETGVGSGDTAPDAILRPLAVRAERNGNPKSPGNGRVYHVNFTADDGKGGQCTGTAKVCVPHDQGKGRTCVDGGPLYNSTAP